MPFFRYVARDKSGKLEDKITERVSQEELLNSLQARGLFVVSIGPAAEAKKARVKVNPTRSWPRAPSRFPEIDPRREMPL